MKQVHLPKLIGAVLFCELIGILATPITIQAIPTWYASLQKPLFSPPNWVFGPVWTLLYFLMGVSVYIIWVNKTKKKTKPYALKLFAVQLAFNFFWSLLFFGLRSPLLGLLEIIVLWMLIALTIRAFLSISKIAGYLLIPYIAWVSFALLLNGSIVALNR